jgi:hypothetical protein
MARACAAVHRARHTRSTMPTQPKEHVAIRVSPADLEEINRRAQARGITKTQLLIDSALDRLPQTEEERQTQREQLDALESRVFRLEENAWGAT